jgi:hypothetical protein
LDSLPASSRVPGTTRTTASTWQPPSAIAGHTTHPNFPAARLAEYSITVADPGACLRFSASSGEASSTIVPRL